MHIVCLKMQSIKTSLCYVVCHLLPEQWQAALSFFFLYKTKFDPPITHQRRLFGQQYMNDLTWLDYWQKKSTLGFATSLVTLENPTQFFSCKNSSKSQSI